MQPSPSLPFPTLSMSPSPANMSPCGMLWPAGQSPAAPAAPSAPAPAPAPAGALAVVLPPVVLPAFAPDDSAPVVVGAALAIVQLFPPSALRQTEPSNPTA